MKVLQTAWNQENNNTVPKALIIPKVITLSREDIETILTVGEEDKVEWKSRGQVTCLFEVYPDLEAFNRRVYPISIFKKVSYLPYHRVEDVDLTRFMLQSLIDEKPDLDQDFSEGVLMDVNLKEYIEGTL